MTRARATGMERFRRQLKQYLCSETSDARLNGIG
jgi:hypothetical protein